MQAAEHDAPNQPATICRPTSAPIPARRPVPPTPRVPDGYAAPYTMLRRLSPAHRDDRRYPQPVPHGQEVAYTGADGEPLRLRAIGLTVEATINGRSTRRLSLLDSDIDVAITEVRTVISSHDSSTVGTHGPPRLLGGHLLHDWVATIATDRHEGRVILSNELTLGVYSGDALLTTTIDLADDLHGPEIAAALLTTIATRRLRVVEDLTNEERHRLGELASGLEPLTRTVAIPGPTPIPS